MGANKREWDHGSPQIAPYGVTDFHKLKGNFGAKIRVICQTLVRNL
jgi:hypothetical protein